VYFSLGKCRFYILFGRQNVQKIHFLSTMLDKSIFLIGFHDEFTRRTQNVTILKIRIHQRGEVNMGYYDGPNLNEEHSETRDVRKSGSKKGYFFHRFSRSCSWGCFN